MPRPEMGEIRTQRTVTVKEKNLNYKYPDGLDLRPGSELHGRLVSEIWARAFESYGETSKRFGAWNEIDKTLTTYIDLTQDEESLKANDPNKPISIVYPNSYAVLETMLAYMMMAFVQEPIFRYQGNSPEDSIGATLMQYVIQQHCIYNRVALNLHTYFRDNFAYGIGAVAPTWKTQHGRVPVVQEQFGTNFLGMRKSLGNQVNYQDGIINEGNALINIDPYKLLLDPSVSISDVQDGEYVGWIESTNLMNLLTLEQDNDDYFNVKYLKGIGNGQTTIAINDSSARNTKTGVEQRGYATYRNPIDVINFYIKLIPSDWNLGDSDSPEIWNFALAADTVIIKAMPLGLEHGKFPISVIASEFDGYSSTPISRIELLSGMQSVLNFLFNSHIANIRKSLNDMFVVDPYLININDMKDPKPGKLIRMRRPGWGRGVENAVQQLSVVDVTRANMADSGIVVQLMKTLSGTDNPMMGNLRQGGPDRLSSAEFQGTMTGAVQRLERVARIISYMGMQDIGYFFAYHTQQLMTQDTYIKTVGQWPDKLKQVYGTVDGSIPVSPFDLIVGFDLMPRDGTIPGGNFSDAWVQLFQIIGNSPELQQRFDVVRVFKHIAMNLGAKNVDEFERVAPPNVSTMPEDQIQKGVQAGNLVPTNQVIQ